MKPVTVKEVHERAKALGADCDRCPHRGERRGPVFDEINPDSKIIVIGAYPGQEEIARKKPMIGQVGRFLDESLPMGGLKRSDASIANDILCAYPSNDASRWDRRYKKAGQPSPRECCAPRLRQTIEDSGARTILTLGKAALESVAKLYGIRVGADKSKAKPKKKKLPKLKKGEITLFTADDFLPDEEPDYSLEKLRPLASIKSQRGHPVELPDGKIMLPTLMPSYAMKEAMHLLHIIREDIGRAAAIAKRGSFILWKQPDAIIEPDLKTAMEWISEARANKRSVVCDIETAGVKRSSAIRCIGLGKRMEKKRSILVIPLLLYSGEFYWYDREWEVLKPELTALMNENPLEFAYGMFDTEKLLRDELMTDRTRSWDDLVIAHHVTRENDAPHTVAFISARFMEIPMWKLDAEDKAAFFADEDD